tara:strand:- start:726 stop:833 length:108 start_codon:yes stop_codon:yes gene_type:complete
MNNIEILAKIIVYSGIFVSFGALLANVIFWNILGK